MLGKEWSGWEMEENDEEEEEEETSNDIVF